MDILEELESDLQKVEGIQNILVSKATGGTPNPADYKLLREFLIDDPNIKKLLPNFVITNRDLGQFWQFIKYKYSTYVERKDYIWHEFSQLLEYLESSGRLTETPKPQPQKVQPVWEAPSTVTINEPIMISTKKKKVFIVHGHDEIAKLTLARFLEQLNLEPIILHEQPSSSKTIIEKIEAFSDVDFAVVLYTPCDVGKKNSAESTTKNRARQNVVFEHGYFIGKLGRHNVTALVKGDVETPNDISGVVYIDLDDRGGWKLDLAKELKNAKYDIDLSNVL